MEDAEDDSCKVILTEYIVKGTFGRILERVEDAEDDSCNVILTAVAAAAGHLHPGEGSNERTASHRRQEL